MDFDGKSTEGKMKSFLSSELYHVLSAMASNNLLSHGCKNSNEMVNHSIKSTG